MSEIDPCVERLSRLDSCAVSDALDKLKLVGVVTGLNPLSTSRRIAGRVVTVRLGVGSAIVFIRAEDVDRVLAAAELIAGREALMAKALLAGSPITEVMGASYEHVLKE